MRAPVGRRTCFGRASIENGFLAPEYRTGELAVYTRGFAFRSGQLRAYDVVIYHDRKGALFFSRVLSSEGDKITVIAAPRADASRSEAVIKQKDCLGKAVWKVDPGGQVK